MRRRRRAEGFSLLEAVIALIIAAIVLAMSLSGRGLLDNRRLVGAARVLATEIRFVEQQASGERRCWRIAFDRAGERYHLEALENGGWTPGGGCTEGRTGRWRPVRTGTLPANIDLVETTFAADRMTVSPFGNPNAGALTLRTPGNVRRVVTVNVLGRVTISP